jgi:hypothetical protein
MNFPPANPQRFMLESIPQRFGNLGKDEFGDFIRYLFQLDGFEVLPVVTSKDLGIHMQAIKDGINHVILPILAKPEVLIDVSEVRRAVQATTLYKANQPWIITTSGFTPDAKKLAVHSDVELWDWEALYEAICALFFEGKSHFEYPMPPGQPSATEAAAESELKLKAQWAAREGVDATWYNLQLSISNPTSRTQYIHLELPAFIDSKSTQVFADQWGVDEFVSGTIYSGATVRTNAQFKVSRLGERPPGGHVAITYHERTEVPMTYHLKAHVSGEACYVVTYCYGRDSAEYLQMTTFRDRYLANSGKGRWVICLYYQLAPVMIRMAGKFPAIDTFLKWMVANGIRVMRRKQFW